MSTTYVDPETGKVYTLAPGGNGWIETGFAVPEGSAPPVPVRQPDMHKIYMDHALANDQLALAMRSANSVELENETYNNNLYARYGDAYAAYKSGKGSKTEPETPPPYWDSNYFNLLKQTIKGEDTTASRPPEPSYNQ